eukprot:jgi/Tetstr1/421323/TSEL_012294.t1
MVPSLSLPTVSGRTVCARSNEDSSSALDWQAMDGDDPSPCSDNSVHSLAELRKMGLEMLNAMFRQGATPHRLAKAARELSQMRPECVQTYRDLSWAQ